jgi:hypothetical protein
VSLLPNIAALATRTDKWLKKNWPGYGTPEFVEYARQVHVADQAILDAVATVPGPTGPKGFPLKDLFAMIGEQGGMAITQNVHRCWLVDLPAQHTAAGMMLGLSKLVVEGAPNEHARANAKRLAEHIEAHIETHVARFRTDGIWFAPFPPAAR